MRSRSRWSKANSAHQTRIKLTWHVVQGLARHFKVKYMNNSTVTEGDKKKAKVARKPRGAIIAEVLQLWPADLDAITVMPPVKKLK